MKRILGKKDIAGIFNDDITDIGSYAYTNKNIYSAYTATLRQSNEVVEFLKGHVTSETRILDVGCGDGVFTFELLEEVHPKFILGFDIAKKAIEKAQKGIDTQNRKKIMFKVYNAYNIAEHIRRNEFDIAVIRGVIHHLENPQKFINKLSNVVDMVIVLEPNGLNPFLKIIEKTSNYHIKHKEKSFNPKVLKQWFTDNGYLMMKDKYFGLVPYFCSARAARTLRRVEIFFEILKPVAQIFCGAYIVSLKKR